jgi:hypothetical protein
MKCLYTELCTQGGAIGMSPQGVAGAGPELQVVDSLFLGNTALSGAGVFLQKCSRPHCH